MSPNLTPREYRRLNDVLDAEIRRLTRCKSQLRRVDAAIYSIGRSCFRSDHAFVDWLVGPAYALRGAIPLRMLRTAAGRAKVLRLLNAIAHNVPQ